MQFKRPEEMKRERSLKLWRKVSDINNNAFTRVPNIPVNEVYADPERRAQALQSKTAIRLKYLRVGKDPDFSDIVTCVGR